MSKVHVQYEKNLWDVQGSKGCSSDRRQRHNRVARLGSPSRVDRYQGCQENGVVVRCVVRPGPGIEPHLQFTDEVKYFQGHNLYESGRVEGRNHQVHAQTVSEIQNGRGQNH